MNEPRRKQRSVQHSDLFEKKFGWNLLTIDYWAKPDNDRKFFFLKTLEEKCSFFI